MARSKRSEDGNKSISDLCSVLGRTQGLCWREVVSRITNEGCAGLVARDTPNARLELGSGLASADCGSGAVSRRSMKAPNVKHQTPQLLFF